MESFDDRLARLVQRVAPGSRLVRSWPLQGGISSRMTGLEIAPPEGGAARWVLRQHGDLTLELNPQIAADEFRLLQILQHAGVPVPAPHHLDSGAAFGAPCLVLDYVDGESGPGATDRDTYLGQLATYLARIHAIGAGDALAFLPRRELDTETGPPAPANPPALLHGDFWPGNVLSRDGEVVAVIDWEDAATGDPLADLAITRLELLWAMDRAAADRFTELYLALTAVDPAHQPHWDDRVARQVAPELARWGLDPADLATMRVQLAEFAARAREQLARG
jgi:aminoglycoside phosphotransferase (APT) family kinase protein